MENFINMFRQMAEKQNRLNNATDVAVGGVPYKQPNQFEEVTETVMTTEPSRTKSLWDLSTDIIRGNYGNGAKRKKALEEEGYNYHQVQDFVNKRLNNTLTDVDYQANYLTPSAPNANSKSSTNATNLPNQFIDAMRLSTAFLNMLGEANTPTAPSTGAGPR